jgi:hypothetical protein
MRSADCLLEVLAHWAYLLPECVGFFLNWNGTREQVAVEVLTPLNDRDSLIAATDLRAVRHY